MGYFLPRNTAVHGISPSQLVGAPEWPNILERINRVRGNYPIVAHNAAFERSVIDRASEAYGIAPPPFTYFCTMKLAKVSLPDEASHSLGILSRRLGLPDFAHHDAGADAEASARLLLEIARQRHADAIESFPPKEWELGLRKADRKPRTV
jgi:DNA polymerase-3 subunit epsilon